VQLSLTPELDPADTRRALEDLAAQWRDARADSADAYALWCATGRGERRMAYAVFLAALDREAAAERTFIGLTRDVSGAPAARSS
jgi:hypothetical protein